VAIRVSGFLLRELDEDGGLAETLVEILALQAVRQQAPLLERNHN